MVLAKKFALITTNLPFTTWSEQRASAWERKERKEREGEGENDRERGREEGEWVRGRDVERRGETGYWKINKSLTQTNENIIRKKC